MQYHRVSMGKDEHMNDSNDTGDFVEWTTTFGPITERMFLYWKIIDIHNQQLARGVGRRVLGHFKLLGGDNGGFSVDRMEHSLQTATRAYRANKSDEYVVCALLHDIGDTLGTYNHPDIAVAIL